MKKELHELQEKIEKIEKIVNACIEGNGTVYKLHTGLDSYVFGSDRNKDVKLINNMLCQTQKELAKTIKNIL